MLRVSSHEQIHNAETHRNPRSFFRPNPPGALCASAEYVSRHVSAVSRQRAADAAAAGDCWKATTPCASNVARSAGGERADDTDWKEKGGVPDEGEWEDETRRDATVLPVCAQRRLQARRNIVSESAFLL
jgi:hypothetical protein